MRIRNGSLPVEWNARTGKLYVEGTEAVGTVRTLGDMRDVLYDRKFAASADMSQVLYHMYRDVHAEADGGAFGTARRRYDVTVIPPAALGDELVKTAGHYHELAGNGSSYPELYEVLAGTAHFLVFKRAREGKTDMDDRIADAELVEAKAGQKVYVPPDFGHVMINPSHEVLVTCNIVESRFKSLYDPVRRMGGAPYFELVNGDVVANERFAEVPALTRVGAESYAPTGRLGLGDASVYDLFIESPKRFGFLEP
jgi:glucose-6-phosphate isomerase, archaeal